ncbi:MAG: nucleoside hydrolase [Proteocatella sp.]
MKNIPIIIDTDPGVDDFIAIVLANSCDKLDIKALTVVAGNQTLEKTAKNALDIASFLRMNTRIAKGAQNPINKDIIIADKVHGDTGIGPVVLEESLKDFDKDYAWDVIYQEAIKAEGKLQIIAIGPLTNIAIAFMKYADLHNHIDKIVIMGGSTGIGNVRPYGEFNIWADPFAADVVFKSGAPITMVGLNVTMETVLTPDLVNEIKAVDSKLTKEISQLLDHMAKTYKGFGYDFVAVHDALAVACVIDSEVLECKDYYVAIETRGRLNEGRTVVDLDRSHRDKAPNASVAVKGDTDKFVEMLKNMMRYYQ